MTTSQGAPEAGAWKTVPVEPTYEICRALHCSWEGNYDDIPPFPQRWKEALATSPSPPPGVGEPIAWLHEIEEPIHGKQRLMSFSQNNPWSHWMQEHRDGCVYTVTALGPVSTLVPSSLLKEAEEALRCGIYCASKTAHAHRWLALRDAGWPVISTWIDEAGQGETDDLSDLWHRCVSESRRAKAVLLYREPGEVLKGAFIEAGAALAYGVPVHAVGCGEFSFVNHPLVTQHDTLDSALARLGAAS